MQLATITYKSLSLAQPTYLHLLLQQYQPTWSLQSGSQNLLALPTLSSEFGRHAFSYCAPSVWNKLSLSIRSVNSFNSFKFHLKPICLLIINIHCPLPPSNRPCLRFMPCAWLLRALSSVCMYVMIFRGCCSQSVRFLLVFRCWGLDDSGHVVCKNLLCNTFP